MTDLLPISAMVPAEFHTQAKIADAEEKLLRLPQVDCPLTHHFAPGVYMREVLMPAGTFVIGHEHKTQHFNMVLTGSAVVMCNGHAFHVDAPHMFVSEPGVRKVLYIYEDMRWMTVHPTHETDLEKLAEELIVKSPSFLQYHADLQKLQKLLTHEQPRPLPALPPEGQ